MTDITADNKQLKGKITKYIEEIAEQKKKFENLKEELNNKDRQLIVLGCSERDLRKENVELLAKLNSQQKSDSSDGKPSENKRQSTRLSTFIPNTKK